MFQLPSDDESSEILNNNEVEENNCTESPEYTPILEENIAKREAKDSEHTQVTFLFQLYLPKSF